MNRTLSMSLATITLASVLVVGFQNCSGGGLPDLQQQSTSSSTAPALAAVVLVPIASPSMSTGSTQQLGATNALGTLGYTLVSGTACAVSLTGVVTAAATVPVNPICTIQITDTGGNLPIQVPITVTSSAPTVFPGDHTFDTDGATTFTVPAFNTLTIEVYGAGGGGGDLVMTKGSNPNGGDGQSSSVVIPNGATLTANGGKGGAGGNYFSYTSSPGGAGGSASGGSTNSNGLSAPVGAGGNAAGTNGGKGGAGLQAGTAPGGGGGPQYSVDQDGAMAGAGGGGGGGGYSVTTFTPSTPGSTIQLSITVGKGGAGGIGWAGSTQAPNGANGRVYISWK